MSEQRKNRKKKWKKNEEGHTVKTFKTTSPNGTVSVWAHAYDEDDMLVWKRGVAGLPSVEAARELEPVLMQRPDIVPGHNVLTI